MVVSAGIVIKNTPCHRRLRCNAKLLVGAHGPAIFVVIKHMKYLRYSSWAGISISQATWIRAQNTSPQLRLLYVVLRFISERCCSYCYCFLFCIAYRRVGLFTVVALYRSLGGSHVLHYIRRWRPRGRGADIYLLIITLRIRRHVGSRHLRSWPVHSKGCCIPACLPTPVLCTGWHLVVGMTTTSTCPASAMSIQRVSLRAMSERSGSGTC